MQMHMDFKVPTVEDLERHREHAEKLGARLLFDRSRNEANPSMCSRIRLGIRSVCSSSRAKRNALLCRR